MKTESILIKHCDWLQEDVSKKLNTIKNIRVSENNALRKIEFYMQEFELSKSELVKMLKCSPVLFTYSEESVKSKVEFYIRVLGISKTEFIKMLKIFPALLSYSEENIKSKINFYQQEFGIDILCLKKMLKFLPAMMGYSDESIKEKFEFYRSEFGITKTEFIKMIKILPILLGLSEDNVKSKFKFYQKEFELSKEELVKMIKRLPPMLSYTEESVKEKYRVIKEIGLSKNYMIQQPNILSAPASVLKVRYAILRQIATYEEILARGGWYITSQNKSYARIKYLKEVNGDLCLSRVLCTEGRFVKMYGITSNELMEKFILIPEEQKNLEDDLKIENLDDFGMWNKD